ncbi:unnamed protein product, partial [Amoebophrya sp. A120]
QCYLCYLLGTLEPYEQVSTRSEALWKRLEHRIEGLGEQSVSKLLLQLIRVTSPQASSRLKARALQILQQRILQLHLDTPLHVLLDVAPATETSDDLHARVRGQVGVPGGTTSAAPAPDYNAAPAEVQQHATTISA